MAGIDGTTGNDTLRGTTGDDTVTARGGNDLVFGSDGRDVVDGGVGTDRLLFVLADAALFARPEGARRYTLTDGRLVDASGRIDTGFTGVERVLIDLRLAGDFGDVVDASALTATGSVTRTEVLFGDGDDVFLGGAGSDIVTAGRGRLTADGGAGVDTARVVDDGTGATLSFHRSGEAVAGVQNGVRLFDLRAIERVEVVAASSATALAVDAGGLDVAFTFVETAAADTLTGGAAGDVFISDAYGDRDGRADRYTGGGGADRFDFSRNLLGMDGTRITDFGADDRIAVSSFGTGALPESFGLPAGLSIGRAAFDGLPGRFRYWSAEGRTTVEYDADGDRVADAALSLDGEFALVDRTDVVGSIATRSLVIDASVAVRNGGAGADRLTGGTGRDEIAGLGGDDSIDGGDGGDRLYGDGGDDRLVGGAGADLLDGGDGNDTLDGGADNDALHGGAGDDVLDGGTGSNSLSGGDGADRLTGIGDAGAPAAAESYLGGGGGNDLIVAANGRFRLGGDEGDDRLTLANGARSTVDGGDGNDVIRASDSTEVEVRGGDGDDDIAVRGVTGTLVGGDGADLIRFSAAQLTILLGRGRNLLVAEAGSGTVAIHDFDAGEAGDRIDLSAYGANPFAPGGPLTIAASGSGTVIGHAASGTRLVLSNVRPENLSAYNLGAPNPLFAPVGLVLTDYDAPDWAGELVGADGGDAIRGLGGKDVLYGGGGDDRIEGGADADFIDGGSGADRMDGGSGDDFYVVDAAGDVVTERAGEGVDTVLATVSHVLAAEVENLVLGGAGRIDGAGNALANTIVGNANRNVLDGRGGADVIEGGAGDDLYLVDHAADRVVEVAGGGMDLVRSTISFSLAGTEAEYLTLLDAGNTNATGNALANTLTGNAGKNVLDGGAGADVMQGQGGDDLYLVDDVGDRVVERAGGGNDLVRSTVSFSLAGGEAEYLTLLGTGNTDATGNAKANTLTGNVGANVLAGGAGADSLFGGAGADRFTFAGGDTGATAATADRVRDFSRTDGDRIDLSRVDADVGAAGDQAFGFIGAAAFGERAGELRLQMLDGALYLAGDVNGDGLADLLIRLDGRPAIGAGDLVL